MALKDLRYQAIDRNPEEMIKHLQTFRLDPKISVGIWYFASGGNRFHDSFVPEMTIEERINKLAEMKGLGDIRCRKRITPLKSITTTLIYTET